MKTVIAIDSFKGCLSSVEANRAAAEGVRSACPDAEIVEVPVSDGGEGFLEAFHAAIGGALVTVPVMDPLMRSISARYLLKGQTAVLEVAEAIGLTLLSPEERNPMSASSYGVGQLVADAVKNGARHIIVGLGGSSTTDGGCGAAAAIGVKFTDAGGREFVPVGGNLHEIAHIDLSGKSALLDGIEIVTMCDIDNPMYGLNGAAYIFGPQKGADPEMVKFLDDGLIHLGEIIKRDLGRDLTEVPGGGAAGAMGVGMMAFFGSRLQMGIETVLDTVGFDEIISDADAIFTGEGKIDSQSLRGKVVIGVARRAKKQGKDVIAVVGGSDLGMEPAYEEGVKAIFTINRLPQDLSVSKAFSRENLAFVMDNILRMM